MGCAQSRIENEESVSRCKDRKQFMRDAVASRNAFAAAHSSYTMSLKNTGAALSDFGQGETQHPAGQSAVPIATSSLAAAAASASVVQPPMESLPPPPPLPDFSPSPLQRSASMPEIPKKVQHSKPPADPNINEDEDEDIEEEDAEPEPRREERNDQKAPQSTLDPPPPPPPDSRMGTWDYFFANYDGMQGASLHSEEIEEPVTPEKGVVEPPPPPPPETPPMMTPPEGLPPRPEKKKKKQMGNVQHQHAASASAVEMKKGKMGERVGVMEKKSVSLLQVLIDLDDHFLKASESAHEVSKMLEANRMHYHSNFADNRGTF